MEAYLVEECPCYQCHFTQDLKARACTPEQCDLIDLWLSFIVSEVSHNGEKPKRQTYNYRMRHPQEVIDYAKTLYTEYSTRDVADKIKERFNIKVSHVTISNWVNKPSQNA